MSDARIELTGGEIAATLRASPEGDPGALLVEALYRKLPFDGHDEAVRSRARHVLEAVIGACLRDPQVHAAFERQSLAELLRAALLQADRAEGRDAALRGLQAGMRGLLSELRSDRLPLRRKRLLSPAEVGKVDFVAFSYERRMTDFIGREAERQALQEFLAADSTFLWWQASGSGGQGKSRLALELRDGLDPSRDGGFLDADGLEKTSWDTIRFNEPTLIIMDYVAAPAKAEAFAKAARRLAQRAAGEFGAEARLEFPVRLLALEREGFDLSGDRKEGRLNWLEPSLQDARLKAALRDSVFRPEPLRLETLPRAEMGRIMRSWRERTGKEALPEARLEARLKALEGGRGGEGRAWRPLFAMMFADQEAEPEAVKAGLEDLLGRTLAQEREEFWIDKEGPGGASAHLAALASMVGLVEVSALADLPDDFGEELAPERFYGCDGEEEALRRVFRGAWNACGRAFSWDARSAGPLHLEARTPDLLGEYLAVWLLKGMASHPVPRRALRKIESLTRDACTLNLQDFLGFLIRLREDFPGHEATRLLLDVTPRPEEGAAEAPLPVFAFIGATGALKAALARRDGLDPDAGAEQANLSLLLAAQEGHEAVLRLLIKAGAPLGQVNEGNGTFPLLQAAQNGHKGAVRALIKAGAAVDQTHENGAFPLLLAAENGHTAILRLLLELNAPVGQINKKNGTFPLLQAAQEGHEAVVTALIEAGAPVGQVNETNGAFPLLLAAQKGHEAILHALIKAGALVAQVNEQDGAFPLLMAARNGHEAVLRALIKAGAAVGQVNETNGAFSLLIAAAMGHESVVRILLEFGASAHQVHEPSQASSLSLAEEQEHGAVVALLKAALQPGT